MSTYTKSQSFYFIIFFFLPIFGHRDAHLNLCSSALVAVLLGHVETYANIAFQTVAPETLVTVIF